ncbi:MAG: 30S ribosomal protein S6 [Patescibacteria group bacterium]
MENYELLYIVSNQYTDEEAQKIKEKIDGLLKAAGAVLGLEENLGKKKLAYPIGQAAHGYYFLNEFELEDGSKLAGINNELRLDKEILRAQIIVKKKLTAKQIEKARKREASRNKMRETAARETASTSAAGKPAKAEHKKIATKNLDDKLEEIFKNDNLV